MTSACSRRFGQMLVLSTALASVVWGCAGGSTNTTSPTTPTPPAPTVSSLTLDNTTGNLMVGQTALFAATANYSDGTSQRCTATAAWHSSDNSVASVTAWGFVTAEGVGAAYISAAFDGKEAGYWVRVTARTPDILKFRGSWSNGPAVVGARIEFYVEVEYSLVSAPWARVGLQTSDQNGKLLRSSPTVDVASGVGTLTLTDEITVPAGTTMFCIEATMDLPGELRLKASAVCATIIR